jgi:integrase/recombinase XerD
MATTKTAKVLTGKAIAKMIAWLETRPTNPVWFRQRNLVMFHLSVYCGLRAKEIVGVRWCDIVEGELRLTHTASKGRSGRPIPLNDKVLKALTDWKFVLEEMGKYDPDGFVIITQRSKMMTAQSCVNLFREWYAMNGMIGCSSHSGRRTFITKTARKIGQVGGSIADVMGLAGHSNLATTQRYIDIDPEAQRKVVSLL